MEYDPAFPTDETEEEPEATLDIAAIPLPKRPTVSKKSVLKKKAAKNIPLPNDVTQISVPESSCPDRPISPPMEPDTTIQIPAQNFFDSAFLPLNNSTADSSAQSQQFLHSQPSVPMQQFSMPMMSFNRPPPSMLPAQPTTLLFPAFNATNQFSAQPQSSVAFASNAGVDTATVLNSAATVSSSNLVADTAIPTTAQETSTTEADPVNVEPEEEAPKRPPVKRHRPFVALPLGRIKKTEDPVLAKHAQSQNLAAVAKKEAEREEIAKGEMSLGKPDGTIDKAKLANKLSAVAERLEQQVKESEAMQRLMTSHESSWSNQDLNTTGLQALPNVISMAQTISDATSLALSSAAANGVAIPNANYIVPQKLRSAQMIAQPLIENPAFAAQKQKEEIELAEKKRLSKEKSERRSKSPHQSRSRNRRRRRSRSHHERTNNREHSRSKDRNARRSRRKSRSRSHDDHRTYHRKRRSHSLRKRSLSRKKRRERSRSRRGPHKKYRRTSIEATEKRKPMSPVEEKRHRRSSKRRRSKSSAVAHEKDAEVYRKSKERNDGSKTDKYKFRRKEKDNSMTEKSARHASVSRAAERTSLRLRQSVHETRKDVQKVDSAKNSKRSKDSKEVPEKRDVSERKHQRKSSLTKKLDSIKICESNSSVRAEKRTVKRTKVSSTASSSKIGKVKSVKDNRNLRNSSSSSSSSSSKSSSSSSGDSSASDTSSDSEASSEEVSNTSDNANSSTSSDGPQSGSENAVLSHHSDKVGTVKSENGSGVSTKSSSVDARSGGRTRRKMRKSNKEKVCNNSGELVAA